MQQLSSDELSFNAETITIKSFENFYKLPFSAFSLLDTKKIININVADLADSEITLHIN